MDGKALLEKLSKLAAWAEHRGWLKPVPPFTDDYGDYPELQRLEEAWPAIREECAKLLEQRAQITDITVLGGEYTKTGIHTIAWKTFVLLAGEPIAENCRVCPRTAAALSTIPGVQLAFFSILEPHQYIRPHWGYYAGVLRYHLGVIIPDDNRDNTCWLRINDNYEDNKRRDKTLADRGKRYFWRNGKGMFFDDTKLHDAANESNQVRVVLWVDVRRRFPWWIDWLNGAMLKFASRSSFVRKVRDSSRVDADQFWRWDATS